MVQKIKNNWKITENLHTINVTFKKYKKGENRQKN